MITNINAFIHEIKQKNNSEEIEIELKLLFDKKYIGSGKLVDSAISETDAKLLFRNLYEMLAARFKLKEHQSVNLVSKDGTTKQILYSAGIKQPDSRKIYSKTRIADHYLTHNRQTWKLKACREHDLGAFDDCKTNYSLIRFKRRFSAVLSADWRIDYTFIIQLPYSSAESTIREARERLFLMEEYRVYDATDSVEVEIEYTNSPCKITATSIDEALRLFPKISMQSTNLYECAIDYLKNMFGDRTVKGDRRLSIKHLLPQTATLNKKQYMQIVVNEERAAEYYISHKLDGERVILFLGTQFDTDSSISCGYLTTEKWNALMPSNVVTIPTSTQLPLNFSAILDCELYVDTLYVFDILEYIGASTMIGTPAILDTNRAESHNLPLYMCPYLVRRKCIGRLQSTLESLQFCTKSDGSKSRALTIRIKPSFKLGALYQSSIHTLLHEKTEYPRDGIIFTSVREPYLDTQYFKWKPPSHMTIEFIAKKCPAEILGTPPYSRRRGKTLYMLYVGIRTEIARAFGLRRLPHYHTLFPMLQRRDYCPIHFAPSNAPLAYLYWDERSDLDNQIVELARDTTNSWRLLKVRSDRQADYLNSQYFGNDYYIAESIWNSYYNPFTADILCRSPPELRREFYFVEDDVADFRATRKFNNWVKTKLLELCGQSHWLLDLGAGKGQDFMKYLQMKIANVIFTDVNPNNIDEIIARKHLYFKQGHFRHTTMATYTVCCDVMAPQFIEQITQFTPYCKLIVCNFAIHYMCYNEDTAKIFAEKIAAILPAGGRLLITYLNGRKVYDRIMRQPKVEYGRDSKMDKDPQYNTCAEWIAGNYHIRAAFAENQFTGRDQQIQIKLPFSGGFYSEHLFDSTLLTKALRAHKINVELNGEFAEFIEQYQAEKNNADIANNSRNGIVAGIFDAADTEYIQLLDYTIYHK